MSIYIEIIQEFVKICQNQRDRENHGVYSIPINFAFFLGSYSEGSFVQGSTNRSNHVDPNRFVRETLALDSLCQTDILALYQDILA